VCHRLACIKQLEQEMTCSVCLDICVRPCTTPCGKASLKLIWSNSYLPNKQQHILLCVQQIAVKLIWWLASTADVCLALACLSTCQISQGHSTQRICCLQLAACCMQQLYVLLAIDLSQTAPAGHDFCRKCLKQALRHQRRCPKCRASIPSSKSSTA